MEDFEFDLRLSLKSQIFAVHLDESLSPAGCVSADWAWAWLYLSSFTLSSISSWMIESDRHDNITTQPSATPSSATQHRQYTGSISHQENRIIALGLHI